VKVARAIRDLHRAETELADELRKVGERHAVEHEVFHTAHVLAAQCEQHAARHQLIGDHYAAELPDDTDGGPWQGVLESLRRTVAEPLGRTTATGMILLDDLRTLFLAAEDCSIRWVMLGQAAKAVRDKELLLLVAECHTETEVQVKWLTTQIKVRSPVVLAAS
jgi:hypothetical protein